MEACEGFCYGIAMTTDVQKAIDYQYRAHSLQQVTMALELAALPELESRHALMLGSQLVNHGLANAGRYLSMLRGQMTNEAALAFIARLEERHKAIQALPGLTRRLHDAEALRDYYAQGGFLFRPGTTRPDTAIVIFTTTYNNYTFSNLILDTMLSQLGTARLFLKDTPKFYYLKGVLGLADDLRDLPAALERYLARQGIKHFIISGFSSGGYPSLYTAARMKPLGYVGYSLISDLSGRAYRVPSYYEALRDKITPDLFLSAGEIMQLRTSTETPFHIIYGGLAPKDREQAQLLEGHDNVHLTELADCNHETTSMMLEKRCFNDIYERMLQEAGL